jgi:TfoX/Sxy family transcriptional regulator of competence genes
MVARHVTAMRALLEQLAPAHDRGIKLECNHFFSGAAAYAGGRIFMTLTSVGLALKLSAPSRESLIALGGRPLRYFPTGPIKQEYVVVPDSIAADPKLLAPWVAESITFSRAVRKASGRKAKPAQRSTK